MIVVITTDENDGHRRINTTSPNMARDLINAFVAARRVRELPNESRFANAYRNGVLIKHYDSNHPVMRFGDPLFDI